MYSSTRLFQSVSPFLCLYFTLSSPVIIDLMGAFHPSLQPTIRHLLTNLTSLTFTTPPHSSNKQSNSNLKALRAQLKLEKVRWHEDKLRAQFGNEVARDERSKSVWGAVMELKKGVEDVLENGWVREGE